MTIRQRDREFVDANGAPTTKRTIALVAGLVILTGMQSILAAPAPTAMRATKIAEARKQNAAVLRHYTWTSRTELVDNGKVTDRG